MPSQFLRGIFEQATIELLNDLISLFVIIDRYKTKTTAFAGFPVFNDFGGNSIPTSAKPLVVLDDLLLLSADCRCINELTWKIPPLR